MCYPRGCIWIHNKLHLSTTRQTTCKTELNTSHLNQRSHVTRHVAQNTRPSSTCTVMALTGSTIPIKSLEMLRSSLIDFCISTDQLSWLWLREIRLFKSGFKVWSSHKKGKVAFILQYRYPLVMSSAVLISRGQPWSTFCGSKHSHYTLSLLHTRQAGATMVRTTCFIWDSLEVCTQDGILRKEWWLCASNLVFSSLSLNCHQRRTFHCASSVIAEHSEAW